MFINKTEKPLAMTTAGPAVLWTKAIVSLSRSADRAEEWYRLKSLFDTVTFQSGHHQIIQVLEQLRKKSVSWAMDEEIDEVIRDLRKQSED